MPTPAHVLVCVHEARLLLEEYPANTVLETIYYDPGVADACATWVQCFEYPDWSHRTIAELLSSATQTRTGLSRNNARHMIAYAAWRGHLAWETY